ncbi:TRAP transporter small permease [Antarcticimicrobium sediminis]|uniref:TRAP transporter small permease protein n=1 Tax=Antarcticimicrobium sediminis TaxID=2546227 RepID=A0A4R5EGF4_9RHOB|nr:TRAP transporter small permease [Antarcticimicrobium sediminis]TDE33327.1 TRAP transporter small permease [Antarcticimicrobium sediminis]
MKVVLRILDTLENAMGWLGNLALAVLMLAVAMDVGGRYFLNSPISGVYEIGETYLMVAIVFLGLAQAQRHGVNVRVLFVFERFPAQMRLVLEVAYLLAAALVFGLIAWRAAETGLHEIALRRWTTGVVPIPTGPSWLIVALGSGVLTLRLAVDALRTALGHRDPVALDHHAEGELVE